MPDSIQSKCNGRDKKMQGCQLKKKTKNAKFGIKKDKSSKMKKNSRKKVIYRINYYVSFW